MRFGEYLAAALTKAGHTQTSFAKKVGQEQSVISAVILGKRKPPLKHMSKWVDVLGKAVDRAQFLELALLANCPVEIQELVEDLRNQLRKATGKS
jgi:transcriptional regulator with XRE-family HTH domain